MTPSSTPSPKIRVLLVDDNQTHQYSLTRHLVESGFEVVQAHNGSETLSLAATEKPDAILLDIHLPDMLGFQVCQQLKAADGTKGIPVVFHSAMHDTQTARSQALAVGAAGFLSYPINVDHLVTVIRGAVARNRVALA